MTALDVPVRSWALDGLSTAHPDHVWHEMAQVWQTPGRGEEWVAAFVAAEPGESGEPGEPEWLKSALLATCAKMTDAAGLEASIDDTMGRSILDLYRSATPNIHEDWGAELSQPTSAPGLVLRATADDFDDPGNSAKIAAQLGARTTELKGLGHWWMMQDPAAAAAALRSFWQSLE